MKVVAIVKVVCPVISGTSDNGNDWEKQQIVVETCDIEPKTLAIEFMGERKTKGTKTLREGDRVEISFGIRCNEYQDKWYTHLDGSSCTLLARAEMREIAKEEPEPEPEPEPESNEVVQSQLTMPLGEEDEDLPF